MGVADRLDTLAVLADIHGNSWALDAVIDDARQAGATSFVDLGDCVAGRLDPAATMRRLLDLGAPTVRGNNDREVTSGDAGASATFARKQLDGAQLAWLSALPATLTLAGGVLACHGSPADDTCYLLEEVREDGVHRREPQQVRELLGEQQAQVVLCAHSHLARQLRLADETLVVNPGSVGCPAYRDDQPWPHAMESGTPHARYALLARGDGGWQVEFRAVTYPWEKAAARARANGREDWAIALATGHVDEAL